MFNKVTALSVRVMLTAFIRVYRPFQKFCLILFFTLQDYINFGYVNNKIWTLHYSPYSIQYTMLFMVEIDELRMAFIA